MWSAGAVVGEMLTGRPLFQGRSDIDQLHKILQVRSFTLYLTTVSCAAFDFPEWSMLCFFSEVYSVW